MRNYVVAARKVEMFLLMYTNTLDMARNLGQPMFQDYSFYGKIIGFVIRFTWMLVGGLIVAVAVIPLTVIGLIYALLPIIIPLQVLFVLMQQAL